MAPRPPLQLNVMTPLVADKKALRMPGFVEDVNKKINHWISADSGLRDLLRKHEKLGRIIMTIKGVGTLPRVPTA
jgi:hypothetical protein